MMESEDSIQTTLSIAGTVLAFDAGSLFGISQQKIENISDHGSPYTVNKNAYSFIVSVHDMLLLSIVAGNTFTLTVFNRVYTFSAGDYTEDLTGFALLYATMLGVENV
jgi:hypothetical protein